MKTKTLPTTTTTAPAIDWAAMLEAHNGDMRGAMVAAGFDDAGTDTTDNAMESATRWAMRLASVGKLWMLVEVARTLYASARKDGIEPKPID